MIERKVSDFDVTVDGAALLDRAQALLTTYCVLPSPEAADAVVLWCAATHALPVLPFAPRLSVRSATKRAGKSRVLEVVSALVHNPLKTVNATVPAIFRSLGGDHPPTLIFDEVDSIFGSRKVAENNEDLRGLLNAGFERGNPSIRCVGPLQTPTEFSSFAMAALAGIGRLPDTIEDRSVLVHMRRRKPSEAVKPFRVRRDRKTLEDLGEELGAWLSQSDVREKLGYAEPESELEDRAADVWESLLMIADVAGGDWPHRARQAAKTLLTESAHDERDNSRPVQLLHDIREVFNDSIEEDFIATETLLFHLGGISGSPWSDKEFSSHRLGKMLGGFGIKSTRDTAGKKRGYRKADFTDAWERYPPPPDDSDQQPPGGQKPAGQTSEASEASEASETTTDQGKLSDASSDVLGTTGEVSDKASESFARSDPVLTLSDASDACLAGGRPCERRQSTSDSTLCTECAALFAPLGRIRRIG